MLTRGATYQRMLLEAMRELLETLYPRYLTDTPAGTMHELRVKSLPSWRD